MNKANKNLSNSPVIAGVQITADDQGRYNLNALHKASGLGNNKAPSQWLRTQTAQDLIEEAKKETVQNCIVSSEGRNGGTFAHELLAISYAGWISPKFQLIVNQVFLDYKKPQKPALPNFENPVEAARAWADAKEETLLLSEKVEEMKVDVKALDRIANADGYMTLRNAAKHLQYPPIKFNQYLNSLSWIYKPRHAKEWIAYQDKIKSGYLIHKISTYKLKDGTEMISEQVLVTAKGICYLAKQLSNQLMVA